MVVVLSSVQVTEVQLAVNVALGSPAVDAVTVTACAALVALAPPLSVAFTVTM
jgi:hypothetical protein